MSFISKTIRDRAISGKFWTERVLGTAPVASRKILDSFDFRPPSGIVAEVENVIYCENRKRWSDFGQIFSTLRVLGATLAPLKRN